MPRYVRVRRAARFEADSIAAMSITPLPAEESTERIGTIAQDGDPMRALSIRPTRARVPRAELIRSTQG